MLLCGDQIINSLGGVCGGGFTLNVAALFRSHTLENNKQSTMENMHKHTLTALGDEIRESIRGKEGCKIPIG